MIDLRNGQITDLLSNSMRYNPETIAMGYAVLQEKQRLMELADRTRLMSQVETLDERTLDYLAVELRTPAYHDSYPLEVKRRLIAGTLPFYAKLGTPSAVEWVVRAIFGEGRMEEWNEYGGEPHHFRIHVTKNHSVTSVGDFEELIQAVSSAKRLSSWLEEVIITICIPPSILHIGGILGAHVQMGVPQREDEYDFQSALHAGGTGGIHASAGAHEARDKLSCQDRIFPGGKFSAQKKMPIPESAAPPPSTTILRTGGVCTIISNLSKGE